MNNKNTLISRITPDNNFYRVDRVVSEIRRGIPILIQTVDSNRLVLASETINHDTLNIITGTAFTSAQAELAITYNRCKQLGINLLENVSGSIKIQNNLSIEEIYGLIGLKPVQKNTFKKHISTNPVHTNSTIQASIELCKIAKLIPSSISIPVTQNEVEFLTSHNDILSIQAEEVFTYNFNQGDSLKIVSEVSIPLSACENTKILAFRPANGGLEHLAILIDFKNEGPILTRIHSECYTGDLIGSLKCDCGDQLRGSIKTIANSGGGILIYLAQEGRGIGLINKLRAYEMQSRGLDTVSANEQLGFNDDERIYLPAVKILNKLNINQVKLLTNNPNKIESLKNYGINVVERIQHSFPSNQHNWTYLDTKAKKLGHYI
jgi:GTP cyclohydrolase II